MKKLMGFTGTTVFYALLNIISVVILTRIFPPSDYGTANLAISIATILATITYIGSDHPLMRYYYTHTLKSILKNTILIEFFIVVSIIIGVIIFNLLIFKINLVFILIIIIYSIGLNVVRIITTIFRMEQSVVPYTASLLGQKILQLIIIILFSIYTQHFYLILLSFIFSSIIVPLFIFAKFHRRLNVKGKELKLKEHVSYSFPHMVAVLNTTLTQNLDKFLLGTFISATLLGVYYAAFKIIGVINIFYRLFTLMWIPKTIKLYETDKEKYNDWMQKSKVLVSLACIFMGIFIIFLKDFLVFILGKEYSAASTLLVLLMFIPLYHIDSEIYGTKFNLIKKPRYHIYLSTALLILTAITNILLVPKFGVDGAVISISFSYLLYFLLRFFVAQSITRDFKYFIFIPVTQTIFYLVSVYIYFHGLTGIMFLFLLLIVLSYFIPIRLIIINKI